MRCHQSPRAVRSKGRIQFSGMACLLPNAYPEQVVGTFALCCDFLLLSACYWKYVRDWFLFFSSLKYPGHSPGLYASYFRGLGPLQLRWEVIVFLYTIVSCVYSLSLFLHRVIHYLIYLIRMLLSLRNLAHLYAFPQ